MSKKVPSGKGNGSKKVLRSVRVGVRDLEPSKGQEVSKRCELFLLYSWHEIHSKLC